MNAATALKTVTRRAAVLSNAVLEALEDRQLFAGVSFVHGTLCVTGAADHANAIQVVLNNGKIDAVYNGTTTAFDPKSVRRISIIGGNKADSIGVSESITLPATIIGGGGNDNLVGGGGNDAIDGGGGEDRILGQGGNDSIKGGIGNDVLKGNTGNDYFVLVERYDKLIGGKGDALSVDPSNVPPAKTPSVGVTSGNTPADTTVAKKPVAVISTLGNTIPSGTSIHVDALSSQLKGGQWNNGQYLWNFGDPSAEENSMKGFNAAHTYDTAGNYTITLTVINADGKSDTTTQTITVTPANRTLIYVSNAGSDSNNGLSTAAPINSLAKAMQLLDDNTQIMFRRGDTFDMTTTFQIYHDNVVIGAYGTGAKPTILWTGARDNSPMFATGKDTKDVTVQDLSIDTIFNQDTNDAGTPLAFLPAGTDFTARRNELLNLQYGMNGNQNPTGVIMEDNTAPLATGIRKYFAWVQGSHITIVGNSAANSTREHIVRVNYVSMMNISDNDFSNISRIADGDPYDNRKTALNVQSGEFAYLYNNKLNASLQVGPLGKTTGLDTKQLRFNYVVADGNEITNDDLEVHHGAQHVTLRDNVIHDDNNIAINVDGYNTTYHRGVVDLTIENNTAINTGTNGTFLDVWGSVAGGVTVQDNLYLAPNLNLGSYGTAAFRIASSALSSITWVNGNIWPAAKTISSILHGVDAMNYIGDGSDVVSQFETLAAWNKLSFVGADQYANVSPTNSYSLIVQGVQVGAKLAA